MSKFLIFNVLFIISPMVYSAKKIHPDESATHTQEVRFSSSSAIKALQIVNESLTSYRKMTEVTKAGKPVILKEYKHSNWEMQNIGFNNALTKIEGTIRLQKFLISRLNLEIAENNNLAENKKKKLKEDFLEAEKEYKTYLNSIKISD